VKIMVCDDDIGSLLVARATVEALGHECISATDGTEAWKLFQTANPDVLITDLEMPGMDGLELCRRVRGAQQGYTYVVLLTAHRQPHEVLAGMRAGADDYLGKPLDPVELEARLLSASRVTLLHEELAHSRVVLMRQARTDALTGLHNRLSLDVDLQALHRSSVRYRRPYALALCDVDRFKAYNDTYGHPAGDQALRAVAATLVDQLRDCDRIYRYGGEEFLVLLPEQGRVGATVAMERVRERLERAAIEHRGSDPLGVLTLSVGVAALDPGSTIDAKQLLAQADVALYGAKAGGRNAVVCGQPASWTGSGPHLGAGAEAAPAVSGDT
jgi:two-component system chemotaxis response regulator CheY